MAALSEDVVKWTLEGIDMGAKEMLIVDDTRCNVYYPVWLMPFQDPYEIKTALQAHEVIADGVDLVLAKDYFSNHFFYATS